MLPAYKGCEKLKALYADVVTLTILAILSKIFYVPCSELITW